MDRWIFIQIVTKSLILLLLISCGEDFIVPYNCVDEDKIVPYKDRICTMEIDYVCGCNGRMYINKCYAEADGLTTTWSATIETNCKQ